MIRLELVFAAAILTVLIIQAESNVESNKTKTQEKSSFSNRSTSSRINIGDIQETDNESTSTAKPSRKPIIISESTKEKYNEWKVEKKNILF